MKPLFFFITVLQLSLFGCLKAQSVDANKFEHEIKQPDVQILDVRTAEEYETGHIPNAMLANINDDKEFNHRIEALDKNHPVYVYCLAGSRSSKAASILKEKGFKKVVELDGGINAWKKADKPVEGKSEVAISPETYNAMIASDNFVLIDFGAAWCPPCRKMQPVINDLKKIYAGKILIEQIDAGAQTELMGVHEINEIPTFIFYKEGKEIWRASGIIEKEEMKEKLRELSER